MSKPYIPQPGTIPARVIDYLKTLPPGIYLSTAALCEELAIEMSFLASSLSRPRNLGAVVSRNVPGNKRNLEWAIGDGTPLPLPPDHEPDEPLQKPAMKPGLRIEPEVAFGLKTKPEAADRKPTRRDMSNHFLAGIFTDGSLLIEHGGIAITLNPTQAAQIARLINQGIQP